jgi:D-aspartate ligase
MHSDEAVVDRLESERGPLPIDARPLRTSEVGREGPVARINLPVTSSSQTDRPHVAVFDADAPPALAFVRSLGRLGVPVHVYAPTRFCVSRFSRYATRTSLAPAVDDAAAFVPWLRQEMEDGRIELIAPTSDLLAFYLTCVDDLLSPRMRAVLPSRKQILDTLLKDRFHARCEALGQVTPRTLCPTSLEEALALRESISWPSILKPRSHVGVGLARGVLIKSVSELEREFRPYGIAEGNRSVAEECPGVEWPMIQEYVPGALQNLYSVSGVLDAQGRVVACAGSRKSTQWPPHLGVGTSFAPHDDARLIDQGVKLARDILGRGIFELELIYDARTDRYIAIDLNPRAFGQIALDIARGHDLPAVWYRLAIGEEVEPLPQPAGDVRWVHGIPYHLGQLIGLMRGPQRGQRLSNYVESLRHRSVDVVHDLRDPLPSLAFTAKMLRHPGGLVRPFLSSRL